MSGKPDLSRERHASGPAGLRRVAAVFLVGFMGSGKTSVGLALARILRWQFHDLDNYIQQREGRTIAEIFVGSGEAEFRRLESAAIREIVDQLDASNAVIALGGGAFVQLEIASILKETNCPVVFLDAPVEELWRRCDEAVVRPMKRDREQFRQLYEARRPHYVHATMRIDTHGKDVETIAAEIAAQLDLPLNDSGKET